MITITNLQKFTAVSDSERIFENQHLAILLRSIQY